MERFVHAALRNLVGLYCVAALRYHADLSWVGAAPALMMLQLIYLGFAHSTALDTRAEDYDAIEQQARNQALRIFIATQPFIILVLPSWLRLPWVIGLVVYRRNLWMLIPGLVCVYFPFIIKWAILWPCWLYGAFRPTRLLTLAAFLFYCIEARALYLL